MFFDLVRHFWELWWGTFGTLVCFLVEQICEVLRFTSIGFVEFLNKFIFSQKCDLETERQTPTNESKQLAKKWGCPFYETSAKIGKNVEIAFFDCAREIRRKDAEGKKQEENGNSSCYTILQIRTILYMIILVRNKFEKLANWARIKLIPCGLGSTARKDL